MRSDALPEVKTPPREPERQDERGKTLLHRIGHVGATVGGRSQAQRRWVRIAMQFGIPLVIFAFLGLTVARQWASFDDFAWKFSPGWIALSCVLMFVQYSLMALIWVLILKLKGESLRPVPAQAIWGKSLLARYVPGNMLMVLSRVVLAEREGVPRRAALSSVIYELGLNLLAAAIVSAYFIVSLPEFSHIPARWAVLGVIPLGLFLAHPRVFRPAVDFALRKFGRDPLPEVMRFRSVLLVTLTYVIGWALMGLAAYSFIRGVTPEVTIDDYAVVAAAFAMAWAFGMLAFISPSGLGTRDVAYAFVLKAGTALPGSVAIGVAIGSRLVQTFVELVWVGVWVGVEKLRSRKGL